MQSMVFGATGIVGSLILQRLIESGERPYALSRRSRSTVEGVTWVQGDLNEPENLSLPPFEIAYSTVHPLLLANALPHLDLRRTRRVVFFTSTSILTKLNSEDLQERANIRMLADGEYRLQTACEDLCIGWTGLRPTLIYAEERDANLTRVAKFIQRFGFFPLSGWGGGLRQPVSAKDLALGAISAASCSQTVNRAYAVPGAEVVSYHEMIGRVFDGLGRRRLIIPVPPFVWTACYQGLARFFPNTNARMGSRMSKHMVFDGSRAKRDFGWSPGPYQPRFEV
ncbi:epimerase [uncultured Bradyrhizobium sp.]|jgi:nucleoside-diphosphate-sugar epimerase|uniref:NAD-dependent epimerase/dehydratase family protein n=1 Tax=uncultured Bradyrhizobium sp. TaxID=199684 RepID=UPI00262EDB98|nr:epimerase [uncultured Bradyrhizobium sp.]